jgi:hypothetical protein
MYVVQSDDPSIQRNRVANEVGSTMSDRRLFRLVDSTRRDHRVSGQVTSRIECIQQPLLTLLLSNLLQNLHTIPNIPIFY